MTPKVAVLMGSANDQPKMAPAVEVLTEFGVAVEEHVMSAHRTPAQVAAFTQAARRNGFGALICGAGMAAHLAGAVAANTTLPVVGVPLSGGALNGVDALYATVQMPRGIPVATVAIDNSTNAALLVIEMLAITDAGLAAKLDAYRAAWAPSTTASAPAKASSTARATAKAAGRKAAATTKATRAKAKAT